MSRGGPRNGTAGKSYNNRSDLNAPKALPVTAVPNQAYGVAGAQKAAQAVVPMANAPLATSNPTDPNVPPPLTGAAPGSMPDPFRPTERPNEHFMTGVNAGPGQGSEALAPNPFSAANPANSILAVLGTIQNPSAQVQFTKNYLAMQAENAMPH